MAEIQVPTASGVMSGIQNYGWGAITRLGYDLVTNFTGEGLIGGAIAAGVASSVVKGQTGDTIATILGFQAAEGLIGGLTGAPDDGGGMDVI